MNKTAFILLFILISCITHAQSLAHLSKIDSIKTQLAQELKPRVRIAKQLKLVTYYKYSHPDVDSLITSALDMAREGGFRFYIARALKFRARYNLYLNVPPQDILADIREIEKISKTTNNQLLPGWISRLYAEYYILTGDLDLAEIYIDSLSNQIKKNKYASLGTFHTIRGMFYQEKKEFTKAMAEYNIALSKKNQGKTFILNNLARLHLELLNPEKAIDLADEAILYGNYEKNDITKINSLVILGDAALQLSDTTLAIQYYHEVEKLRRIPYLTNNYTSIHRLIDINKTRNISYVDSILTHVDQYKMLQVYPKLLAEKGLIHLTRNDIQIAENYCKKAHDEAINRKQYKYASLACDCLVSAYRRKNDTDKVADYLSLKIEHQQIIQDEKRIISLARNLADFESKKERELINQAHQKDQLILSEKIDKYKLAGILGSIILMITCIALWQLRSRNKRIASQNKVISKALDEKDILLREIHHRVKNNLQLVSSMLTLQGRSIDDELAQNAILEGKNRVRSMALIHQDLYNKESITGIGVKEYLNKLTQELLSTYCKEKDKITLTTNVQDIDLDIDSLVPLGLIINELFSNSLKYAFPDGMKGNLYLSLQENDNQLVLEIKDNGIGYDPKEVRDNSFGTTLVSALTAQLGGTLEIDTTEGTQLKFKFSEYQLK